MTGIHSQKKDESPRAPSDLAEQSLRRNPFAYGAMRAIKPRLNDIRVGTKKVELLQITQEQGSMEQNLPPTKLEYYDNMSKLQSTSTVLSSFRGEDGRDAVILDSTIFHPQGGGQPADTGFICTSNLKFLVQDVRSRDRIVFHYGVFDNSGDMELNCMLEKGVEVSLSVDEPRRMLNTRYKALSSKSFFILRIIFGWNVVTCE
ncbi:unnamed protein product [Cuscuta campestris]|uniref:Alanyl-tRNA synthetase class IIc N-terminal domain-containing protein n=1 Tax=Cuscuta campestris TaxID=132261 RepID=A0A484KFS0_9ASTE|nr:unnamed protein product [Cuscuta campestris]